MPTVRRQLTLFVNDKTIELIRLKYNPEQFKLISAHVTLCREDELEDLERVYKNLQTLKFPEPLQLTFLGPERFDNGKGVYMPTAETNPEFEKLREAVLSGIIEKPKKHLPHITLMHPRNSICTDIIFQEIRDSNLPLEIKFDKVSVIEQEGSSAWVILREFCLD